MFECKILADSISQAEIRLTTLQLTYPRFIHAEFMTHRLFSRNAASSRAIPVEKKLVRIKEHPAEPIEWGKNKKGMQSDGPLSKEETEAARTWWHKARMYCIESAQELNKLQVHKQVTNRIIEPWEWITVICSSTNWSNFLFLRDHPAADPNIQKLAQLVKTALNNSNPRLIINGWHLPLIEDWEILDLSWETCLKLSAARCARVSYLTHDGKRESEKDIDLCNQLIDNGHMSPLEHQAKPIECFKGFKRLEYIRACAFCKQPYLDGAVLSFGTVCLNCATGHIKSGNFTGWQQFRKLIPKECH